MIRWLRDLPAAFLRRVFPCAYDSETINRHDYGFRCSIYDAFSPGPRNLVIGDDKVSTPATQSPARVGGGEPTEAP